MRYFITFSCYGAHFHGEESGSVDRCHNLFGSPTLEPDPHRATAEQLRMTHPPYRLNERSREVVLSAIRQHCAFRSYNLMAAHVRTNHIHIVVEAESPPEKLLNEFKSYASRALNRASNEHHGLKRWARHGSTRYLWLDQAVRDTVHYVIHEQGEPMSVFVGDLP